MKTSALIRMRQELLREMGTHGINEDHILHEVYLSRLEKLNKEIHLRFPGRVPYQKPGIDYSSDTFYPGSEYLYDSAELNV